MCEEVAHEKLEYIIYLPLYLPYTYLLITYLFKLAYFQEQIIFSTFYLHSNYKKIDILTYFILAFYILTSLMYKKKTQKYIDR